METIPNTVHTKLPSRGIWYGDKLPEGMIGVRATTGAEDLVLDSPSMTVDQKVTRLIKACVDYPNGFSADDLTLTDRFAAMVAVTVVTYGTQFKFPFPCAKCEAANETSVNVATEVTERTPEDILKEHPALELVEPFEIVLPISKKKVSLRHLRASDEAGILKRARSPLAIKVEGIDPLKNIRTTHHIVKIDDAPVTDSMRDDLVRTIHSRDRRAIERTIEMYSTGMNFSIPRRCSKCGFEQRVLVPFGMDFFRGSFDFIDEGARSGQ